ncbi:hypothetical protein NN6n1_33810 [Shinella zoogloeoides]
MARALGDLRLRVLKAADGRGSARQAAARFGVGISSAIRWIARAKIGERMDITLNEMVERLDMERSMRIG